MDRYTDQFRSLAAEYVNASIEFPELKEITVAQWTFESGYGASHLATEFLNFAGLKWREEMNGYARPVEYAAHDGTERYCAFGSLVEFIRGYWHFLDRSPYNGWQNRTGSPEEFIRFIGPIYTPTASYADTVIALLPRARTLIKSLEGGVVEGPEKPPGTSEPAPKPSIKEFIQSPNFSSRNGERIRRVVLHYTTSRNVDGTISWFKNPRSRVSAHYIISRNGDIYQMVRDADKAWHAKNANADSIGIEHSAAKGDQMTSEQEASSVALVRWLLSEYKLTKSSIWGHKYTPENAGTTDCPDHLFGDDSQAAV
ncbi:MAG: N-acetylmuramoyl-L-alanine amidase, partial [Deltaproteobacteria bacterium]|nr:N-acetylmuramoyl-L-alanine amidase [Deltaproteobacteria bacterium]